MPVLAYPDFSRSSSLDTDASNVGIGAVLPQVDKDGQEQVIAYGSRALTKPERHYCVTRKKLLAVVTFIQLYRPYLTCQKFTLHTDHESLTWLRTLKNRRNSWHVGWRGCRSSTLTLSIGMQSSHKCWRTLSLSVPAMWPREPHSASHLRYGYHRSSPATWKKCK